MDFKKYRLESEQYDHTNILNVLKIRQSQIEAVVSEHLMKLHGSNNLIEFD